MFIEISHRALRAKNHLCFYLKQADIWYQWFDDVDAESKPCGRMEIENVDYLRHEDALTIIVYSHEVFSNMANDLCSVQPMTGSLRYSYESMSYSYESALTESSKPDRSD